MSRVSPVSTSTACSSFVTSGSPSGGASSVSTSDPFPFLLAMNLFSTLSSESGSPAQVESSANLGTQGLDSFSGLRRNRNDIPMNRREAAARLGPLRRGQTVPFGGDGES